MKRVNIINILVIILCFSTLGLLSYNIYKLNMIPNKYLLMGFLGVTVVILILLLLLLSTNRIISKIATGLLIILSIGFMIVTMYLDKTNNFLDSLLSRYESLNYSVVVLKNSNYKRIEDLNNKTIFYNGNIDELNKKITFNKEEFDEYLLYSKLMDSSCDAIVLEDGYLSLLKDEVEDFESNIRVIYTFKIRVKNKPTTSINLTSNPFILYISGIDQYGNVNSVRGRSDVNQIMVINPNTKHILIVNTPRDYYVHLHGTTGLRDKLTHAGIYGINKSIDTLNDVYGININHYVRVNFDTLIKVIDEIGGIDIYSDKAFRAWTNSQVYINQGWNHLNGKEALAYSRERKSYIDGDHHRGRNQQQVLEAIINKLSNPSLLISKYNAILNKMNGSLQTDIDKNTITSFIKYQIDKNPSWNVETMQANGYASWNYTYSMGYNYYLWVMEPDYSSIEKIKARINEVLQERVEE